MEKIKIKIEEIAVLEGQIEVAFKDLWLITKVKNELLCIQECLEECVEECVEEDMEESIEDAIKKISTIIPFIDEKIIPLKKVVKNNHTFYSVKSKYKRPACKQCPIVQYPIIHCTKGGDDSLRFFADMKMNLRQNSDLVHLVKHKNWVEIARFMQNTFGYEYSEESIENLGLSIRYAEPGRTYKVRFDPVSGSYGEEMEEVGIEQVDVNEDDESISIPTRGRSFSI